MCKSISKLSDNDTATIWYNFDAPINQAEEEDGKDLELPKELARVLEKKADNVQSYQESIETINLGTEKDTK